MGVESWCFCKGVGKSEKMKAAIFSGKGPAMAHVSGGGGAVSGTGFLIHRNLLVTTHGNVQSVAAAEGSEIRLRDGVSASLFPHRFFITSSVLDLTIVGLDIMDGESSAQGQQPHWLKTCSKPNLELGSIVYLLGYTEGKELVVGEGKVVIATDNLIKLSTDGVNWRPGSAGFDSQGNLAFMICDPMKLATSLNNSSSMSTTSTSSMKNDTPLQFGIPVPIICDWLNQHWEGNLDELSKPKLPLIRLMSTGQKSEHSCASFTMRRVFKSAEPENDGTPSSSNTISKARDLMGASCPPAKSNVFQNETRAAERPLGIPTPEIYESRKLTSGPVRKKEATTPVQQLLDINFPPRNAAPLQPPENHVPHTDSNCANVLGIKNPPKEDRAKERQADSAGVAEAVSSTGSVNDALSEVQSCSSPMMVLDVPHGYSSEGETMYSAETAESRNYTSPREGHFQQVGRSQSCVNYNRWGAAQRTPSSTKPVLDKHKSFTQGRKVYSQGTTSQRSNDFLSPTVSSIMKKRNNMEQQPTKPRPSAVHSSPKWNF
uniref:Uncharacterized protein n=1 Tax=Kalanchoe fedtschenkoi TaxID=63787 RepID=A0A7N0UH89_KALFE